MKLSRYGWELYRLFLLSENPMRERPSWSNFLLGLAKFMSARSPDEETQHGTVVVDQYHRILATGCNGFPRGMKHDDALPATRPEKYPWMIHSEANACCSTNTPLEGSTAYVTGKPCFNCTLLMWQHGVKKVVHIDGYGWSQDEQERTNHELFLLQSGMQIQAVKPDFRWIVDFVLNDKELGPLIRKAVAGDTVAAKIGMVLNREMMGRKVCVDDSSGVDFSTHTFQCSRCSSFRSSDDIRSCCRNCGYEEIV